VRAATVANRCPHRAGFPAPYASLLNRPPARRRRLSKNMHRLRALRLSRKQFKRATENANERSVGGAEPGTAKGSRTPSLRWPSELDRARRGVAVLHDFAAHPSTGFDVTGFYHCWHEPALRLGCLMSINPDAHCTRELDLTHWRVGWPARAECRRIEFSIASAKASLPRAWRRDAHGRRSAPASRRREAAWQACAWSTATDGGPLAGALAP
jgi:hypothetical protein